VIEGADGMSMEKIIQDQLGSIIFSGLLFFIQLYFRSVLSDLKKEIAELKADNKENANDLKRIVETLFSRINNTDKRVTSIEARCEERRRRQDD
jgi:hypothetical protein